MTAVDRFVATAAIRSAIEGLEADVLEALKIPWRQGKPHIRCPYPQHVDQNPSWRWDERKQRAYCTCIPGSHAVLDVLMQVEQIDFDLAKIRAAQLLNRSDLIRSRRPRKRRGESDGVPPEPRRNGATPAGCGLADYAEAKRLPLEFLP